MSINLTANCIAHYKMNDNAASKIVADSQKYSDGTAQQNTEDLTTDGKVNEALTFNGSSDYVNTNDPFESVFQSSFTINQWIKPSSLANAFIFGCSDALSTSSVDLYQYSNGFWIMNYTTPDPIYVKALVTGSGFLIAANEWQMLTIIVEQYSPTLIRVVVYRNGELAKTGDTGEGLMSNYILDYNLYLGSYNLENVSTSPVTGYIDNVMIFNKALSQDEIDFLYNNGDGSEELVEENDIGMISMISEDWS